MFKRFRKGWMIYLSIMFGRLCMMFDATKGALPREQVCPSDCNPTFRMKLRMGGRVHPPVYNK